MKILSNHVSEIEISKEKRIRTIGNWLYYKTPHEDWDICKTNVGFDAEPPMDWNGEFEFEYGSRTCVLQSHFGDRNYHVGGDALIGVRSSENPENWLNMRALNGNDVWMFPYDDTHIEWPDYWSDTNLQFTLQAHRIIKEIEIVGRNGPRRFQFSIKIPAGHSFEIVDDALKVYGDKGKEWLHSPAVWGVDGDGKDVRVSLVRGEDILFNEKIYPTIWVELNEEDHKNAVLPITVDPALTLTGTLAIQDVCLQSADRANLNDGVGSLICGHDGTRIRRSIVRIASDSLPNGTVSSFKMIAYRTNSGNVNEDGGTLSAYRISAANTWVEGTGGNAQAGSSCWNFAKYNTQVWAGSAGCGTPDVDYINSASPPALNYGPTIGGPYTWTLDPTWVGQWKTANNGFLIKSSNETTLRGLIIIKSSENAQPSYFEMIYTTLDLRTATPSMYYKRVAMRR